MAEAMGFTFKLGEPAIVPKYFELDIYQWMPDAHLTVMRHPSLPGKWRSVWSSQTNFFLLGDTPYPEDHKEMETKDPVLVTTCDDAKCWHNGGTWLNAMFPVDGKLVGILHAEDHYKDCKDTGGCSYKSSAVSHSSDGGLTWTAPEQIVTQPGGRPAKPEWGGSGDNCAVKGHDGALYLFYTGNQDGCSVKLARSTDPMGRPGTWYKYYKGAFSEPGLGGRESLLEELQVWGGNPSVIWNAGLQLYIMTWHSWEGANLHISSSPDLMHWAPTVQLVADVGRKSWYPTILGCRGDEECGLLARLYYTDMDDNFGDRKWIARDIECTPVGRKGQGRPKTVLLTEKEQHSGVLRAGQELQQNIPLRSPDGKVELLLQINGYLVLYNSAMVRQHGYNYNTTISAVEFPGTAAPPFVLAMQEDGNLVAYNHAGSPVFYTETYGAGGDCHLLVSSDNGGYFAVLDSAGKVLYAKPAPPPPKPSDPATKEGGGQEECPAVEGLSLHEGAQQQCPAAATS